MTTGPESPASFPERTRLKLGPLLVLTPDLDEARAIYRDVLGLQIAREFEDQIVFELANASLHVFRCRNRAPESEHGQDAATVMTFEVAGLEDVLRQLKDKGVRVLHRHPAWNAEMGWAYAAFHGPGGLVHELVERGEG